MALTDAQLTDARRYLGYGVAGTTLPITDDQDVVYLSFGMTVMSLHKRLGSLSATEETVVGTYLTNLNALEAAIVSAGANLDTEQAAVWTHNPREVADREALYNSQRRQFAAFLGCPTGPGLAGARLLRG